MHDTWRKLIDEEMRNHADAWDEVVGSTLGEDELDIEDVCPPFTLWTKTRVYFAVEHDECPLCESVPRHPCAETTGLSFD